MLGGDGAWVLAFDYRGFGLSSRDPDEAGLIEDALAVIVWPRTVAKVLSKRTVLLAQSLGTGVVAGALEKHADDEPSKETADVLMFLSFADAPSKLVFSTIFGEPAFVVLHVLPPLKRRFIESIGDKGRTKTRLEKLVMVIGTLRLTFVAATNDEISAWRNFEDLSFR